MATHEAPVGETPEEWVGPAEPSDEQAEKQLGIARRLGDWKSIASFALAVVVLAIAVLKGGINPTKLWDQLRFLNPWLFLSAFVVYYLTFPLRGYRWKVLLQNAYRDDGSSRAVEEMSVRGLSEILYISWFVNCVVPAKLGDLYRAYLAKLWSHISWTKTVGTVMAERITDILVLSFMLAVTGLIAFHGRLGHISIILLICLALAVAGIVALVLMKLLSERIRRLVPERFRDRYSSFEAGTLDSFRRLPLLLGLTVTIWLMEGARLQLVFLSLHVHTSAHVLSGIPFAPMLFLALGTAVLTTIPFTPGGLGLVEVVLLSVMVYLGVNNSTAGAVIVADRILSYWSIAIIGFVVYLVSKRSHFRHPV